MEEFRVKHNDHEYTFDVLINLPKGSDYDIRFFREIVAIQKNEGSKMGFSFFSHLRDGADLNLSSIDGKELKNEEQEIVQKLSNEIGIRQKFRFTKIPDRVDLHSVIRVLDPSLYYALCLKFTGEFLLINMNDFEEQSNHRNTIATYVDIYPQIKNLSLGVSYNESIFSSIYCTMLSAWKLFIKDGKRNQIMSKACHLDEEKILTEIKMAYREQFPKFSMTFIENPDFL